MPEEFILALSVLKMDYDLIYKQSIHAQENEDMLNVVTQMFLESFDGVTESGEDRHREIGHILLSLFQN